MSFGKPKKDAPSRSGTKKLSNDTQDLIAGLLKDTNLSKRQQEAMKQHLTGGVVSRVAKAPPPRVAYPKVGGGPSNPLPVASRFSGIRLKEDIVRHNPDVYEREQFRGGGKIGQDREAMKESLCKTMEYHGKTAAQRKADLEWYMRKKEMEEANKAPKLQPISDKDAMVDEILAAINERQQFLEDMTNLGQGGKYEKQIKAEVGAKLALLRQLGVDTNC
uniref:Uncharacterized protein n=1 Tax=Pyramimonas obovata TaxID=1411642 RepID=A0A7S0QY60_9CHLO|mmetsp:Transcript_17227/g.37469  ORF Transcript_17227/g.37469 Transcript_17227/m.37469 type:complete len:219 (+) Transcript_17227:194-850(+)|eukprot:CAMPEP_0118941168 /NCGR_PEP_ID=MMETSP1169-20130426/33246_1 /TAXON_ID=36882 /ORGANISM="Pyramimonas obovata, Strain CCMP722" /LENGTH=218 /DNA_ID=CAMNT_0006885849 /DNA_START=124 /DNA_END=780 /DNA_ORIENTATION=-